ncbi:hypothetical protein E2C01_024351 [Portunus trituberculatus]|uniref:Uncharacterized protein n=1 Tax=Portunus trituberculatus TaxID=210409 RepID=A0A5B7EEG8_PORTR|nr:hypothetical protein [Portunus trituberculatus]
MVGWWWWWWATGAALLSGGLSVRPPLSDGRYLPAYDRGVTASLSRKRVPGTDVAAISLSHGKT